MYASDGGDSGVNPFQQVAHGAGRHGSDPVSAASLSGLAEALAAQFERAIAPAGTSLKVRIRRLRIIIADPAALRAAGLQQRLGAAEPWLGDEHDGDHA